MIFQGFYWMIEKRLTVLLDGNKLPKTSTNTISPSQRLFATSSHSLFVTQWSAGYIPSPHRQCLLDTQIDYGHKIASRNIWEVKNVLIMEINNWELLEMSREESSAIKLGGFLILLIANWLANGPFEMWCWPRFAVDFSEAVERRV